MGAHVESAEGESLEVVSIKYHVAYELVELIAGAELLQVSPTHRIVIRGPTTVSTKEAKDLELGCQVMCSSGARPLREVRKFQVPDGQPVLSIRCKPSTSTLLRKAQVAGITTCKHDSLARMRLMDKEGYVKSMGYASFQFGDANSTICVDCGHGAKHVEYDKQCNTSAQHELLLGKPVIPIRLVAHV